MRCPLVDKLWDGLFVDLIIPSSPILAATDCCAYRIDEITPIRCRYSTQVIKYQPLSSLEKSLPPASLVRTSISYPPVDRFSFLVH